MFSVWLTSTHLHNLSIAQKPLNALILSAERLTCSVLTNDNTLVRRTLTTAVERHGSAVSDTTHYQWKLICWLIDKRLLSASLRGANETVDEDKSMIFVFWVELSKGHMAQYHFGIGTVNWSMMSPTRIQVNSCSGSFWTLWNLTHNSNGHNIEQSWPHMSVIRLLGWKLMQSLNLRYLLLNSWWRA